MEKNFTELHVGGVYEARDGEIVHIIAFNEEVYNPFFSSRDDYLNDGSFFFGAESVHDLVKYLGEYTDIIRLPEIMAENERLKAESIKNAIDGLFHIGMLNKQIKDLKAKLEQLGRDAK
jgi:hypothetical protein